MATKKLNLVIRQGETFTRVIRWETPPYIYKAITGITQSGPCVITSVAHGLKSGWRAAVVSVRGMREINAEHSPPRDSEFHQVTVLGNDTVSLNEVNSSDYSPYTSGGYLQFYTPVNLTGYSARMQIKDRIGGTVLLELTDGAPDNRIVIDAANNTVTLTITPTDTAALGFISGTYDLEMVSAGGVVTTIFSGRITIVKEVTT